MLTAASARRDFDRVAEVEDRRRQALGIERDGIERGRGQGDPESTPA